MQNSAVRKELVILATVTEQFTPKFSAAGFFPINQSVVMTLISVTTTYFIICLQFHLAH